MKNATVTEASSKRTRRGLRLGRFLGNTAGHTVLTVLSIIWIIPLV